MLQFLSDNLDKIGLFVGTIGLLSAYIFYRLGKKEKSPKYSYYSRTLIENTTNQLTEIELLSKGENQTRITVVDLSFWNDGKQTINRDDIVTDSPIGIKILSDVKVMDAQIINCVEKSNQIDLKPFMIKEEETFIPIDFDYLDCGEGALIQLVHNGKNSTIIKLIGKIKGSNPIQYIDDYILFHRSDSKLSKIIQKFQNQLFTNPKKQSVIVTIFYLLGAIYFSWKIIMEKGGVEYWILLVFSLLISIYSYLKGIKSSAPNKIRPRI
jgi:hypothetical protein